MARPRREAFEDAIYHVTTRGVRRLEVFRNDIDRRRFVSLLAAVTERHGWRLLAYVLMGNHVHHARGGGDHQESGLGE